MRGSIRHRGDERAGSWEYIVDIGMASAQRCPTASKRFWIERRPQESCPTCGGELRETEERRREIKGGFATQKECQAAMNKLLVAVEQQTYQAPTKATVRQYLTKEWLPAVKATIRPSTYNSYVQHVECHIAPHIGSVKLQKLSGSQVNALYAKLAESGKTGRQARPLAADHPPRPRLPAQGLQGRRALGPALAQPAGRRRPAACQRRRLSRDADLDQGATQGVPGGGQRRPPLPPLAHHRHDRHATRRGAWVCAGSTSTSRPAGSRCAAR